MSDRLYHQTVVARWLCLALVVGLTFSLASVIAPTAVVARESDVPVRTMEPVMGSGRGERVRSPSVQGQPRTAPEPRGHEHRSEAQADEQARQTGRKVEVVASRTESSTLFAKPDGSRELRLSSRPVRVRRGDQWVDIDPSLTRGPLGVVPTATTPGLRFSPGGLGPAVVLSHPAGSLRLGWEEALPRPELDGATATYRDVRPGMDLVLTATATGFEQSLVLHERPTTDVAVSMPLELDGLRLEEAPTGGLRLRDLDGTILAGGPTPVMWDSSGKGRGDRPRALGRAGAAEVDLEVLDRGKGRAALVLRPERGFLSDPESVSDGLCTGGA